MGPSEWIAIASVLLVLGGNAVYLALNHGRYLKMLEDHEDWHKKHFETADDHKEKLADHETRIRLHAQLLGEQAE